MCNLYFEKHDSGELQVLMIHGWASSHRMWKPVVEANPNLATYWLIDLPDFGASHSCELREHTIEAQTRAVSDFIEKYHLQPDIIVAHSMGTIITIKLLEHLQYKPQRLLLIAPIISGALGVGGSTGRILRSGMVSKLECVWVRIGAALLRQPILPFLFFGTPYNKSQRQAFIQDYIEMNNIAALELLGSIASTNLGNRLDKVSLPVLICAGTSDQTIPVSESYLAAEKLPDAKIVVFPEADHHPYMEYSEQFSQLFQHFLRNEWDDIEQFES